MQLIHAHSVLNPTNVGNNFSLLAHINDKLVHKVKMYSHQICMLKIKPGMIIIALVIHDTNSTIL
jgi:hypothetical protein